MREKYPYSEFFWIVFSRIRTEYGEILRISSYSVQMPEYGHFFRSAGNANSFFWYILKTTSLKIKKVKTVHNIGQGS